MWDVRMNGGRAARGVAVATIVLAAIAAPSTAAAPATVVSACDDAHLRQAVEAAPPGGLVRFGCNGTIRIDPASGPVRIDKGLTIDGAGRRVIIDGGDAVGLFFTDAAVSDVPTVTFANLTLTRGKGEEFLGGGAIVAFNDLVVRNVRFHDNTAPTGGAVRIMFGPNRLTVERSTFLRNRSTEDGDEVEAGGGALKHSGSGELAINESTFGANRANGNGGAVQVCGEGFLGGAPRATVTRSNFSGNVAERSQYGGSGGAIAIPPSHLRVAQSRFTGNSAGLGGGAAAVILGLCAIEFNADVLFEQTRFNDNRAAQGGGALLSFNSASALRTDDSDFSNNSSTQGGAIAAALTRTLEVMRTHFRRNTATHSGGAIAALGGEHVLQDVKLQHNSAPLGAALAVGFPMLGDPLEQTLATRISLAGTHFVHNGCTVHERSAIVDDGRNKEVPPHPATCGLGRPGRPR